jgi:hypothetical protein
MMNKPSTTITVAGVVGAGMTLLWLIIPEITDYQVPPAIVAATATFVSVTIGYFTKEKRYRWSS